MTVYIKQNDTSPALTGQLFNPDGSNPDLDGATVKFIMRSTAGGAAKVDSSATIITASTGNVKYVWSAANTDTVGSYEGEFEVTFSGGAVQTYPNKGYIKIEVVDDLA